MPLGINSKIAEAAIQCLPAVSKDEKAWAIDGDRQRCGVRNKSLSTSLQTGVDENTALTVNRITRRAGERRAPEVSSDSRHLFVYVNHRHPLVVWRTAKMRPASTMPSTIRSLNRNVK